MPTSRATLSPGLKSFAETDEPTAVTIPEDSWPRDSGSRTRMSPLR